MNSLQCPNCASTDVKRREPEIRPGEATAGAVIGGALLGPLGAIVGGAHGSGLFPSEREFVCQKCGRHFWPDQQK